MSSTKQITLSVAEYNEDLRLSFRKGVEEGSNKLIALIEDILDNGGVNIQMSEDADPELKAFLDKVKERVNN